MNEIQELSYNHFFKSKILKVLEITNLTTHASFQLQQSIALRKADFSLFLPSNRPIAFQVPPKSYHFKQNENEALEMVLKLLTALSFPFSYILKP